MLNTSSDSNHYFFLNSLRLASGKYMVITALYANKYYSNFILFEFLINIKMVSDFKTQKPIYNLYLVKNCLALIVTFLNLLKQIMQYVNSQSTSFIFINTTGISTTSF